VVDLKCKELTSEGENEVRDYLQEYIFSIN